jgi:glycerol-3-phosphate dehydrogenase
VAILRDSSAIRGEVFDLIIVGGGVQGAALSMAASARGLRSLLLERRDFGSGTSAQSLRILHGGLRYLQSLDLPRFRESVAQRRWWLRTFPELVRPLPCLLPLYGEGARRRCILRPALLLNDLLSARRNAGVPDDVAIPSSRTVSRDETMEFFPGVRVEGLQGAALWHDASMISPHRLMIEMLHNAVDGGATALNYMEVLQVQEVGGRATGVRARDVVSGEEVDCRAPVVVNTAGHGSLGLLQQTRGGAPEGMWPCIAFNLLLDHPLPAEVSVGVHRPEPSNQVFFLRPHGERTFAGTVYLPWRKDEEIPDRLPDTAIAGFLSDLRAAVPGFEVEEADVLLQTWGVLPASSAGSAAPARRPVIVNHGETGGPPGLWSVAGVKFTTAPAVAGRVLDQALGRSSGDKGSGGSAPALREGAASPPGDQRRRPVRPWLSPGEFLRRHQHSPSDAARHIVDLVDAESVVNRDDLVLRRLDWGLEGGDVREAKLVIGGILERFGRSLPSNPVPRG